MNLYEPEGIRAKAAEHWVGAQAEHASGRFSTAAALAYYACFQTMLAEHVRRGWPPERNDQYSHGLIHRTARTVLEEIGRSELIEHLEVIYSARIQAQYTSIAHSPAEGATILRIAREVLEALGSGQP